MLQVSEGCVCAGVNVCVCGYTNVCGNLDIKETVCVCESKWIGGVFEHRSECSVGVGAD
eukprot:m.1661753 g.1661753  ORF g.1661753 m.1661753 type:complete len:59 (+) comp126547_c0_seq1:124-300(+)